LELPLERALLSSTSGLEEESLKEEDLEEGLEEGLEEEGLDEGLEEEGCCPQFGRWSPASVVVDFVVVDVGACVVNFTPPVSTKVTSLLPTPNRFGLFVVLFFLDGRDFLVSSWRFSDVLTRLSMSVASEGSCLLCSLPHAWAVSPNLSFATVGFLVVVVVVAASVTSSKRSCSLMLPPPPNVWESPRWFFEGLFVVVVVSLTSSNGTCSLVLTPPPNVWESPRRFFEGLFVVDVVVVCGLRPPFSALQTKSFQSFFGGSTDFCQTGRGSGLTVALEAHWDSSHSPGASVAGVRSG